jgi:hypothetical protein
VPITVFEEVMLTAQVCTAKETMAVLQQHAKKRSNELHMNILADDGVAKLIDKIKLIRTNMD